MKLETGGKIDRWIGPSLCFLCTLLRKMFGPGQAASSAPPQRILFLKLTEMGATVLACEAFRRAEHMVGRDNVFLLTLEENRPVTEIVGLVPEENLLTVRIDSPWTFLAGLQRHISKARRLGIDAVVDLEFFMRLSAMLAWWSGARIRVGLHRFNWEAPYRGDLFTHKLQYNPHLHTAHLYDAMVRAIEEPPGDCPLGKFPVPHVPVRPPRFEPAPDEHERVLAKLERAAGAPVSRPIILLNPNFNDVLQVRRWPAEHYAALARAILERYKTAQIFCVGLAIDRDAANEMCREIDASRMFSLAGETTFRELLTLFTLADVLVSADSGPPHFAAMTDIDTVVLFGPETPKLFGPLGKRTHVLTADFACSPCVTPLNQRIPPCNDNACMAAISPETVLAAVNQCLAERGCA